MEGGEGLANVALDCISTDQSDLTEAIHSNSIHDSHGSKPSHSRTISPVESVQKAYTRVKPKGTEFVLNSSCHFTGSQVHAIGIPEKRDLVQCLLDPLHLPHAALPRACVTGLAGLWLD